MAIDQLGAARVQSHRSTEPPDDAVGGGSGGGAGPGRGASRPRAKRADVQGLRAVAVVLVVLNHLTDWPRGGFVGVDVFFVISGYLITGLLLRDAGTATRLPHALRHFYWRRITRLLPASLTVTVGTLVGAYYLFSETRFTDTRRDAAWATGFLANNHFADVGTDYFAANRAVSPFQHYWSLSVEEQFYVVWPLAVLGLALTLGRRASRSGLVLLVLPVLATIASFAWAIHLADVSVTTSYFSTPARAWELGLGASVACLVPSLRLRRGFATALSSLGVAIIVVSAFVVGPDSGLPAPGALLPCLGAALCVAAVSRSGAGPRNALLTNRLATHVGDISYSVYLVHFPIIVLLGTRITPHTGVFYAAAALMIVGAATVLHHLVELPGMAFGARRATRARVRRSGATAATLTAVGSAVTVVALGLGVVTLAPDQAAVQVQRFEAVQVAMRQPVAAQAAPVGPAAATLSRAIRSALAQRSWPTLNPSLDAESRRLQVPADMQQCGAIVLRPVAQCAFGPASASHTLYLVGDSTAMAYSTAYRNLVQQMPGWRLRVAAAYGCAFTSVVLRNADAAVEAGCAKHNTAVLREIDRTRPDVVLVTNSFANRTSRATGKLLDETAWGAALSTQLAGIPAATRIALVEPAPLTLDPYACYQPGSAPVDCAAHISSAHQSRGLSERRLAADRGWTSVNTEGWFCDAASGYCPAFAAGVPIRHDALHLTYAYDEVITPVVGEALRRSGVLS